MTSTPVSTTPRDAPNSVAPLPLSSRTMKQACTKTKSPQTFGLLDAVGGGEAGVPGTVPSTWRCHAQVLGRVCYWGGVIPAAPSDLQTRK
jgi:hypothetical protein